jgi:hypothetical protein
MAGSKRSLGDGVPASTGCEALGGLLLEAGRCPVFMRRSDKMQAAQAVVREASTALNLDLVAQLQNRSLNIL